MISRSNDMFCQSAFPLMNLQTLYALTRDGPSYDMGHLVR